MTANNEHIFSQISEVSIRIYRELCMNSAGTGDMPSLLTELCRTVAECEYAELWMLDKSRRELRRLSPSGMTVPDSTGLLGRAVASRQPITGTSDEPRTAVPVIRSVLVLPVFSDSGETSGAVRLINKTSADGFTDWDIRRLSSAAMLCGTAVVRAGLNSSACIDKLTGLRSVGALMNDLSPDGRYGSMLTDGGDPLSLFICDIDKFCSINEVYGMAAGDSLLRSVADTLSEFCRPEDTVYRLGGEEFAVVMPSTKLKECAAVAERLRIMIQERVFVVGGKEIKLTLSFGCCRYDPALSAEGNISAADARLYIAKQNGRNRIAY